MDAPWGVCAVERQYWDRQASLARPFDSADGRFDLQLTWFAGIHWGFQKHQACVLDDAGKVLGEQEFEHGGAGLSEMANWLLSFAAGEAGEVGVATETPRGPVVESLLERGFAVHSINPKQLDRFRDRLLPAGAKDDRRDARTLAAALRTDPHCLRRLEPTNPVIVELREWSRLSEDLTRERVRLANRMREQLWRYYPQFLDAVDDVAAPLALDLWRKLPTPRAGPRVREASLARVLRQHRIRRITAATLRDRPRPPAVKVAPGAAEAATVHVRLVVERLILVNRQLDDARHHLDRVVHQLAEPASADDPDVSAEAEPGLSKVPPPTRPSCFPCPSSAPACSPRYWPKVATHCSGGTTTRYAVSAEWLRSLRVQARACSSRAVWPPTSDYASPPNATRSATPSIRCSATAPPSTGTAPAPPLCEKRDAATTGHPVPLCSNPKRVEEDTKTPLAKWWGVLFLDQNPVWWVLFTLSKSRVARSSWRRPYMASILTVRQFLAVVFGNRVRGRIKPRKEGLARYIQQLKLAKETGLKTPGYCQRTVSVDRCVLVPLQDLIPLEPLMEGGY